MPLLQWNEYDFIGCLEVEPKVDEDQVWHEFEVRRDGVVLQLIVRQYESVVQISLAIEPGAKPLIELAVFVRDGVVTDADGTNEWVELRDCILAGSRFSYIEMGDVFDRRRYPHGHQVRILVRPQIRVEIARA
jgi:hypothetical protein